MTLKLRMGAASGRSAGTGQIGQVQSQVSLMLVFQKHLSLPSLHQEKGCTLRSHPQSHHVPGSLAVWSTPRNTECTLVLCLLRLWWCSQQFEMLKLQASTETPRQILMDTQEQVWGSL